MATDKPFQIDLDQIIQSKIPRIYPKIPQFLFRYLEAQDPPSGAKRDIAPQPREIRRGLHAWRGGLFRAEI